MRPGDKARHALSSFLTTEGVSDITVIESCLMTDDLSEILGTMDRWEKKSARDFFRSA